MLSVSTTLLLLTAAAALTSGISLNKIKSEKLPDVSQCSPPFTSTVAYPNCNVDLVVALDLSVAMNNQANIATLIDSVLTSFIPLYQQYYTNTAVIAFGASTVDSSNFYSTYEDICRYIHTAQSQSNELGMFAPNLTKVFEAYRDNDLNKNRDYQQVLVVFTAVTDSALITQAQTVANQVRSAGAQVIVVNIGTTSSPATYANIADQVFTSPSYGIAAIANKVSAASCSNSGVTHTTAAQMPSSTLAPPSPLSNEEGTPCSTNTQNAWLDLALIIDISSAMSENDLQRFGVQLATIFEAFTIGNTVAKAHNTRVAVITYATDAAVQLNFTQVTDFNGLMQLLLKLQTYNLPDDNGGNIQGGLQAAYVMLRQQKSFRIQGVVLAAAAYNPVAFNDPAQTAKQLKDDGVSLFTISYDAPNGLLSTLLSNLSSPGYDYINTDQDITAKITYGLTQINCVCPPRQTQFSFYNAAFNNFTVYADCLNGYDGDTDPQFAPYSCTPGILASVTSLKKLDFIVDNVVVHDMPGAKNFTVGATLKNGIWSWANYNSTVYSFGAFPIVNASTGSYGYFNNIRGFNWQFLGGGAGISNARPYICQTRACDADYFCDLTVEKL